MKPDATNFELLLERVRLSALRGVSWEAVCLQYHLLLLPAEAYDKSVESYYRGSSGRDRYKKREASD